MFFNFFIIFLIWTWAVRLYDFQEEEKFATLVHYFAMSTERQGTLCWTCEHSFLQCVARAHKQGDYTSSNPTPLHQLAEGREGNTSCLKEISWPVCTIVFTQHEVKKQQLAIKRDTDRSCNLPFHSTCASAYLCVCEGFKICATLKIRNMCLSIQANWMEEFLRIVPSSTLWYYTANTLMKNIINVY